MEIKPKMIEDEIKRNKAHRNLDIFSIISSVFIITFLAILISDGQDDYRYYWDSDYRNEVELMEIFLVLLILVAVVDFIDLMYRVVKISQLREAIAQDLPGSGNYGAGSGNNLWPCPDCGNMLSKMADVCPKCGRKIAQGEAQKFFSAQIQPPVAPINPQEDEISCGDWVCTQCGAHNASGGMFCNRCGEYRF